MCLLAAFGFHASANNLQPFAKAAAAAAAAYLLLDESATAFIRCCRLSEAAVELADKATTDRMRSWLAALKVDAFCALCLLCARPKGNKNKSRIYILGRLFV